MIKKKVLVTGGAGFLGSNLCGKLLANKCDVIAVDDLSTGSYENIRHLLINENFKFIKHNIIIPIELDFSVDYIFNLACPASPPRYQADPIKTTKTSVIGSLNMLELAKKNGATILQASTSEVYGDPNVHPQPESYRGNVNPIGIRSCYDEGKRCAESLFFDYHRMYGTNIKVVRIFNTYGPRMDACDGRVVSNFIVGALKGEPLILYGGGLQTRSFCYVDDLIDGLIKMMNSDIIGPVNLGNPEEYTVEELAKIIVSLTKSKSSFVCGALPKDDPKMRRPNIDQARKALNWYPEVSLKDGIDKTIQHFNRIRLNKTKYFHGIIVNGNSRS